MKTLYRVLDDTQISNLVESARVSKTRRARINFHPTLDAQVQEMVICAYSDTNIMIHGHRNKSESFCVLHGLLNIYLFEDNAPVVTSKIELEGGTFRCYYRLDSSTPHLVIPKSDPCIFLETTCGPFIAGGNSFTPEWAISTDAREIAKL